MPINTIHRAPMLDQLRSNAIEKQQMLAQEKQDSISEAGEAKNNIARIRQEISSDNLQMYYQNVQRQRDRRDQLSQGARNLFESRTKIKSLRRKETQQSQVVSKYRVLMEQYAISKAQEIKQQQIDAQNRQSEIYQKAQEMYNNILAFRQNNTLKTIE